MSCIVGFITEECSFVGTDSGCFLDGAAMPGSYDKLVYGKRAVAAYVGSELVGNALDSSFQGPRDLDEDNMKDFLDRVYTPLLEGLRDSGAIQSCNGTQRLVDDSVILIGSRKTLFIIKPDLSYSRIQGQGRCIAFGEGAPYAYGAFDAIEELVRVGALKSYSGEERCLDALRASSRHASCVEPFSVSPCK
jgi:hypothetical protein